MKRYRFQMLLSITLLLITAGIVNSQEPAKKPAIDPEADVVLRKMSDRMKKVPSAIFRVADTIDDVQENGRKLQFAHTRELTVVRPDKLKIETVGDVTNRTLWKDGKTLTVFDKDKNVYAQLPDPGTIDQAIDMLQEKYNMSIPGADLLSEDVYKVLTEGSEAINYIGLSQLGEEKCHHLAAIGRVVDWQLWVSPGEEPAPRKMVITYKELPGEPQYTMQLLKMEDASKIKEEVFTPQLPKDAQKIAFQPPAKPE